jgi:predicted dehydrogenase
MLDMTRWMLELGWPSRVSSSGGIFIDKASKANISDTQSATFEFPDLRVNWQHRSWGESADPTMPWGATFYGDKGTLKVDVMGYEFTPLGGGEPIRRKVTYEFALYPEDRTEKDLETHVAPAVRHHMMNFLGAIDTRSRPISDIEEGFISASSCILANNSMKLGRSIEWDAKQRRVVNDEEANKLLARAYRGPWVHPGV